MPQSHMAGEKTSPTQPFSSLPDLAPLTFTADQAFGDNEKNRKFCHDKVASLVNEGIFTPVSTQTTLLYPGSIGGVEWGSPAIDPQTGIMYSNTNALAFDARLVPRIPAGSGFLARADRKFHKWLLRLDAKLRASCPICAFARLTPPAMSSAFNLEHHIRYFAKLSSVQAGSLARHNHGAHWWPSI